jgi:(p)ppGpp synthase/HD superfamily hydrolase
MLTARFDNALLYAHHIHRTQRRKGTAIPYVAHVIAVASIVLEYGGDETQAVAALLHDTLEDAPPAIGAAAVRDYIREQFGDDVLAIVEHCTDTDVQPKPPWRRRKARYLEALQEAPQEALIVSAADKLHNLRALLRDFRAIGDDLWARFNPEAGRVGTLGYHRALVDTFTKRLRSPIVEELERVLAELEAECGGRCAWEGN